MRILILLHRWTGITLCLFFVAWFFSGAVMIYVPFPSLSEDERLAGGAEVVTSQIRFPPSVAIEMAGKGPAGRLRIVTVAGRPVYVVDKSAAGSIAVDAAHGGRLEIGDKDTVRTIAEDFLGVPVSRIDGPLVYDQWVVYQGFDRYRPYYRVHAADKAATILYISAGTGEVLQKTTGKERFWNYLGAVVHWIYPTFLRKSPVLWDRVVWWLSLAGIAVVATGLWLGIRRLQGAGKNGFGRGLSPFHGWMYWHHILGLVAGVFVLTWIASGWLSMDHGRLFSSPDPSREQLQGFHGAPLDRIAGTFPHDVLGTIGSYRELELTAIGGQPLLIARNAGQTDLYSIDGNGGLEPFRLTPGIIEAAVQAAWPAAEVVSVGLIPENDRYARLREGQLPLTTYRIVLDDPQESWIHVDGASGQILSVMDRGRRLYRWLFNGLHALDFPGLVNRRPLWDAVILCLLAAGLIFSVTALVIGTKRLFSS